MSLATLQQPFVLTPLWLALAGLGIGGLLWGTRRVRGTTLAAPLLWAVVSLATLVASELLVLGLTDRNLPTWAGPLRFAATMSTFCPLMAVLGAKRPQDRGWQFIVLSLWLLLMVPSGQALLFQPGEPLALFPVWSWFLLILLLVGLANYLPTRFWVASLLVATGQVLLLSEHLPFGTFATDAVDRLIGVALFVLAIGTVAVGFPPRRRGRTPLDQVWIDFRDWFGAVWGLRVAERMRASATLYHWPVVPTWHGFAPAEGKETLAPEVETELLRSLRSLLRRFVSPEWIAERLHTP